MSVLYLVKVKFFFVTKCIILANLTKAALIYYTIS